MTQKMIPYFLGITLMLLVLFASVPVASGAESDVLEPIGAVGKFLDDTGITSEIKIRLLAEKGLEGSNISVTTTSAVVSLDGTVANISQAALAEQVARGLSNVKGVDNNLKIARP